LQGGLSKAIALQPTPKTKRANLLINTDNPKVAIANADKVVKSNLSG
jgi:hypothetical protein